MPAWIPTHSPAQPARFVQRSRSRSVNAPSGWACNITMFRQVDDPTYTVPAWMGLPKGCDVTGNLRPNVEHVPEGQRPELGEVLDQDVDLVAAVGEGCRSSGFKGPLWGEQEVRIRHFHRELDPYISGKK